MCPQTRQDLIDFINPGWGCGSGEGGGAQKTAKALVKQKSCPEVAKKVSFGSRVWQESAESAGQH